MLLQSEVKNIARVEDWMKSVGALALIIGLLSMVVLQTFKDLLPWRQWFQKDWMLRWLAQGMPSFRQVEKKMAEPGAEPVPTVPAFRQSVTGKESTHFSDSEGVIVALADLVNLATAGDEKALFELPIEQFCGQTNAALQLALDHPPSHVALIWCLGHLTQSEDLDAVLSPPTATLRKAQNELNESDRQELDKYTNARVRLSHQLQRAIDGFQVATGSRWKLIFQMASIGISLALAFVAMLFAGAEYFREKPVEAIVTCVGIGLAAGFIGPVSRDLLSALQSFKK
jgi:hypothetical protein